MTEKAFADLPSDRIARYDQLLACIRSGQVSAAQIQEHLRDEVFAAYWRERIKEERG